MIYIQCTQSFGYPIPHHFDCSCAMYGAIDTEMDFRLVTFEEVQSGRYDKRIQQNLFVGSVEFMREVFRRIGLTNVRVPKNSNREHDIITLAEAHERISDGSKLFIKPMEIKLFTGLILDGCVYSCLENLPSDTMVMAYQPFTREILTEWRVYIRAHKIEDARNYSGDFRISPDYQYIHNVVKTNKIDGFPSSYTIDVGVLSEQFGHKKNVVVEFNDMWAIGNYGMENDRYLRCLKERYFEIVKK